MALEKTGYIAAQKGTTKQKVMLNADGNIATEDDEVAATKYYSINQVNASNSLQDNAEVMELFLGFIGGGTDSLSNQMTVRWEVA